MTNYVWSVKDPAGNRIIKEVTAGTVEDAKAILLATGYTELELKEDEVGAIATASFSQRRKFLGEEIKVTAEQRLKARDNPPITFGDVILNGLNQSKGLLFLLFLLSLYNGYRERWISVWLLVAAALLWLIFLICLGSPSVYYKKLILAADWYRWDEVLSLVQTLKVIGRISFTKVPDTELTRYQAKALAGTGHLDEALTVYKVCEGRTDCPSWLYKMFVGSLYTLTKQYNTAIEYNMASIQEKPTSTGWLDLSYRYARYKRDPAKARNAMKEAEKFTITDIAVPFKTRCLGVIAYLEGDYATAKLELEKALALVAKVKWRPYNDAHLNITRAYLTCVLAKQGDLTGAKQNFAAAKEYLTATKEDELIAECRKLIGE